MDYSINFEDTFNPYIDRYKKVSLDKDHETKLASTIMRLIKEEERTTGRKLTQLELKKYERLYMQVGGDVVMEQFLKMDFVDYNSVTSHMKRKPFLNDIGKINVDIIVFSHGLFPLVYRKVYGKIIFICKLTKTEFYICGLGTPEIINNHNSKELVILEHLKQSGKAGFYGFDELIPIPNYLGDFIKLIS